ncbi:MAG: hypothetical protein JKY31_12775 [Rhodobacteraceae bacterium]|nr:hypothetical protein [Paracoccaceae bacterium]
MIIIGTAGDDTLEDTGRRDKLTGGDGLDVFVLGRDGKRDFIMDFEDGVDRVDFSDFNVTYEELFIYQIDTYRFVVEIRGELTEINFQPPEVGDPPIMLTVDDFLFDPGAAAPGVNLIADTDGRDKLIGTGRPDVFLFNPDGVRDAIRRFELGKDQIDITTFDTTFADLDIQTIRPGRIIITFETDTFETEHLIINDRSKLLVAEDFTADDFIFA